MWASSRRSVSRTVEPHSPPGGVALREPLGEGVGSSVGWITPVSLVAGRHRRVIDTDTKRFTRRRAPLKMAHGQAPTANSTSPQTNNANPPGLHVGRQRRASAG